MYSIEELDIKDGSEQEQIRTRKIFENIRDRTQKGEPISEHEKNFFCMAVKLSIKNDGKIEDYLCCANYKFTMLYLSYFHDLSGRGKYEKVKGTTLYEVGRKEIVRDIYYLSSVAINWERTVGDTSHSDELLKQISKETREDLKAIEKNKGHLIFRRDKERYILDKRRTLLQSKYIYCTALQIFEMFDNKDFILNLNGKEIEINEYSIIHILSRHFSEITKQNPQKSYHTNDISPKYLNKQLGEIFELIDKSGYFADKGINNINFRYKNVDYAVWINERTKQVKGKGNVQFNRLETFYPIEVAVELDKLKNSFEYKQINDEVGIYIEKVLS